jgi:nucleotide-binding universal stress UspA family protein
MFQNIGVGTDGSERAWRAIARAAQLAAACDATLHVIHAYQGTRESIEARGRAVIERSEPQLAAIGARVQSYALQGDPADVMIEWAQSNRADLVVVGNKGMGGRRGRLLGSVPNAVAHEAPCAVMIVPTQEEGQMLGTVVVGTDGSERAGRAVVHAAELAGMFGATLHLVYAFKGVAQATAEAMASGAVVTAPSDLSAEVAQEAAVVGGGLEGQAEALRARGLVVETHAIAANPPSAILDTANQVGADLIVVGNKGMTGAKRMLGSIPNTISHSAECAVLIVPTDVRDDAS